MADTKGIKEIMLDNLRRLDKLLTDRVEQAPETKQSPSAKIDDICKLSDALVHAAVETNKM